MKDTLDPFADLAQPTIQTGAILHLFVRAARCLDEIVGLIENARLPFEPQEAFIRKDVTEGEVVDHGFGSDPFIDIGRHQIVDHRDTVQGGDGDQFVAKVLEIAAGTLTIVGIPSEITLVLISLVAQHWHRFGTE